MRSVILAAAVSIGLTMSLATAASAHPPGGGYYGNGPHDVQPHWHKTYTPYGPVTWYGNGPHDLMPHNHTVTPWGGVRSYSYTPYGPTKSYNGFPGGYGGYPGGFGGYPGYGGYSGYGSYYGGFGGPVYSGGYFPW
ncbi:MAG: hypothetical protein JWO38_1117 [Gemmataceae bacterium]|nr:hypothetical protein [Gemmataceae bacterium]